MPSVTVAHSGSRAPEHRGPVLVLAGTTPVLAAGTPVLAAGTPVLVAAPPVRALLKTATAGLTSREGLKVQQIDTEIMSAHGAAQVI